MEKEIYKAIYKVNSAAGSGSCFYLKKYNIFVTNNHVVEGFKTLAIQDNDKNPYLAHVVMVNPVADLAFLVADGDFSQLPELNLANGNEISIGQKILVAGYPFGMPFTVTEGTVSAPKQLMDGSYYIQTDAAVNPGNSGGAMLNPNGEVIAITVSKFVNNADNMGFGIPVETLKKILAHFDELDTKKFNVQCNNCEEFISETTEYCPSCGTKLPENVFKEREVTALSVFCEKAIADSGVNPVLARVGSEQWKFYKGSSEIRMFVYDQSYLFCTSPINLLPKKNIEPVLKYLLSNTNAPYQLGLDDNQIYISYRVHLSDLNSQEYANEIQKNITNLAIKADELDNYLVDTFGCEFSNYAKNDAK